MTDPNKPTRGEYNCNPGNIRHSSAIWLGMAKAQPDTAFVTFEDATHGIRALAKLLINYQKQGLGTLREIVNRWAPPVENDTGAYVSCVAHDCGCGPDDRVSMLNPFTLQAAVTAIIRHENGRVIYTSDQIAQGVALALPAPIPA